MVDRPLGLRRRAGEVEDEPRVEPGAVGRGLDQRDPLPVQSRLVDAVVLGVVLPDVLAVRDLAEQLGLEHRGRPGDDRVEARLDLRSAVPREQIGESARTHEAGRALRVEVAGQRVGHPRVASHDRQRGTVRYAAVPELDRRHHEALLEHAGGVRGHRPGDGTTDVVVVPERLHERDHLAVVEDRHRDAQVGQVPDAPFGEVDVVVEEHVALVHGLDRVVADDRVHQRGVRPAGQLAQATIMDAGPEVVRVPDHRRPRRAADRGLHLPLDRGKRALDDLHEHGIDRGPAVGWCAHARLTTRSMNASTRAT